MHVVLQNRFREKLNKALELSGMSQTELGRLMGVSPQYVHNYLKGHKAEPSLSVVERFADALGVPPHVLIDESDLAEFFSVTA